jgi:hypothetical protein
MPQIIIYLFIYYVRTPRCVPKMYISYNRTCKTYNYYYYSCDFQSHQLFSIKKRKTKTENKRISKTKTHDKRAKDRSGKQQDPVCSRPSLT